MAACHRTPHEWPETMPHNSGGDGTPQKGNGDVLACSGNPTLLHIYLLTRKSRPRPRLEGSLPKLRELLVHLFPPVWHMASS